ncbi:MAG: MFS transporter [Ardenticatenia bacterium]|nr:MFS transporter [Ardenticatenia bacterium]
MNRRLTIALVAITVFLYWVGLYLYVPTLPTYAQTKTGNLATVGMILSMYGLWQAIIRLPVGIAADWLGWRKPFILVGLTLVGLGAWLMGAADGANGLLVGRIITGLAAGTWVPLVVMFSSLFPPRDVVRATAWLNFIAFGGRVLATSVTGWLNEMGGYSLAFNLSAGAAVVAVLAVLVTHESRRPPQRPSLSGLGSLTARGDVLLPSLLSLITHYAIFATTFGFLPILARQLGASDAVQSILVSMNLALGALSSVLVTAIVDRVGARRLVYLSFVLSAMGMGLAAVATSLASVFVAQGCLGLGFGISYPVLMGWSIQRVEEGQRTTAMGLFQSAYSIGMFAGSWVSGLLAHAIGIQPMLGVTACVCLTLGLLLTRRVDGNQVSAPV